MNKTATLSVRIDPDAKAAASRVFDELGISASTAINMMYKFVAREQRLPVELISPYDYRVTDVAKLSDRELIGLVEERLKNCDPSSNYGIDDLKQKFGYTSD